MDNVTYLEDVDEFGVGDVAVLVLIEVVEDDAKLLSSEEDAQLRHELLKLQLLEHSILVAVEALKEYTSSKVSKELYRSSLDLHLDEKETHTEMRAVSDQFQSVLSEKET